MTPRYHVFLSHNSADKVLVERLASRLTDDAALVPFLDLWHLVPGDPWQEALERALDDSATCAVFLGASGLGSWENEEMRVALDTRVRRPGFRVIPVLLPGAPQQDLTALPRFLQRLTWVDFRTGLDNPDAFRRLVAGIRGKAPGRDERGAVEVRPASSLERLRRVARSLAAPALLIVPGVVAGAVVLQLMYRPVETRVRLDLHASRLMFTVAAAGPPVLAALATSSVGVRRFERVSFRPARLAVRDPRNDRAAQASPASVWRNLSVAQQVDIVRGDDFLPAQVQIVRADGGRGPVATFGAIASGPGTEVIFEADRSGGSMVVRLDGVATRATAVVHAPFDIVAGRARLDGVGLVPSDAASMTYRADPGPDPGIEILSAATALTLDLTPVGANGDPIVKDLDVTTIKFTRAGEKDAPETALTRDGSLMYPDHPGVPRVAVDERDLVVVKPATTARLVTVALTPAQGFEVRLDGIATELWTGAAGVQRDRRLTAFEDLWHGSRALFLAGLALFIGVPAAAARLLRARLRD